LPGSLQLSSFRPPVVTRAPISLRRPNEWPEGLDIATLRAGGWRPTPFRQFVLKVHGRCDLACDYCYVYRSADRSWQKKPAVMTDEIAALACDRIAEHASRHGLKNIMVILHGGEPLLAPPALFDRVATRLRSGLPSDTGLNLRVQSNGVSLTAARLDRLLAAGYRIGISLDGDATAHNRHRRYADGRGSFARVQSALRLLATRPGALTGLLCTIDLRNDPLAVFAELLRYSPPEVDFLLPHGNWQVPPPGRPPDESTPYGDWLVRVFDHWYDSPVPPTQVRIFAEILALLWGGASRSETVGLSPSSVVVIDTDGTLEQVDALKSAYDGAASTDLRVQADSFDAALELPAVAARQVGVLALSDSCKACPVHRICGSGYYPHRYRPGTGFRNPSVFCPDLGRLINHVAARMRADLPTLGITPSARAT
jgi:uncharacterized protein